MVELNKILVVTVQQTLFSIGFIFVAWIVVVTLKGLLFPRMVLAKGLESHHYWLRSLIADWLIQLRQIFLVGLVGRREALLLALLLLQFQIVLFSEWFADQLGNTFLVFIICHLLIRVCIGFQSFYQAAGYGMESHRVKVVVGTVGLVLLSFSLSLWARTTQIHEVGGHLLPFIRSPGLFILFFNSLVLTPFFILKEASVGTSKRQEFMVFLSKIVWFTWVSSVFLGDLSLSGAWVPFVRIIQVVFLILSYDFLIEYLPKVRADKQVKKLLWFSVPLFTLAVVSIYWKV